MMSAFSVVPELVALSQPIVQPSCPPQASPSPPQPTTADPGYPRPQRTPQPKPPRIQAPQHPHTGPRTEREATRAELQENRSQLLPARRSEEEISSVPSVSQQICKRVRVQ